MEGHGVQGSEVRDDCEGRFADPLHDLNPWIQQSTAAGGHRYVFEIGPRLSFATAWSTNAVAICRASGISSIERIERSRRYRGAACSEIKPQRLTQIISFFNKIYV